jgi:hypothetical protein
MRDIGWQVFGGNLTVEGDRLTVTPLDAFRSRVYLAPVGLWLTLDAGRFERVEIDLATRRVRVALAAADPSTPSARLRIEQPADVAGTGSYVPAGAPQVERGAFVLPLGSSATWVELAPQAR